MQDVSCFHGYKPYSRCLAKTVSLSSAVDRGRMKAQSAGPLPLQLSPKPTHASYTHHPNLLHFSSPLPILATSPYPVPAGVLGPVMRCILGK